LNVWRAGWLDTVVWREGRGMLKPSYKLQRGVGLTVPLVLGSAFALAGCTGQPLSTRERGTLGGGVLGVGSGAIMGSAVGHPGAGAAIGGALGAGTG
jgi:hypothetical protein